MNLWSEESQSSQVEESFLKALRNLMPQTEPLGEIISPVRKKSNNQKLNMQEKKSHSPVRESDNSDTVDEPRAPFPARCSLVKHSSHLNLLKKKITSDPPNTKKLSKFRHC
jgi:hypothetical protein